MNPAWLSPWWQFVVVAAVGAAGTIWPWIGWSLVIARDVKRKRTPYFVAWLLLDTVAQNRKAMEAPPNTRAALLHARLLKGFALLLNAAFLLAFELLLWIDFARDRVTLERALLTHLTLFLPFVLFTFVPVYLLHRYLNRLPQRDAPNE